MNIYSATLGLVSICLIPILWVYIDCNPDTKEKPYICHCGRSFTRKDLLTRHERLNHHRSGRRSLTPVNAGADGPVTPSSDLQHETPQLSGPDALPNGYLLAGPDHQTSAGLLLASQDDPIFDYTMLLNAPEMSLDGGSFTVDSMPNQQNIQLNNIASPQFTPASPVVLPQIPDKSCRDGRWVSIKPVSLC